MIDRACEDKLYQTPEIAGAVRYNVPTGCATLLSPRGLSLALRAIHLVSRLRRVNRLCSRTVSDTANKSRKTRKKKSSAVPIFRSGHMSAICARLSKGKGRFTRGWKPQVSTLLCARAASAQFRSLLKRHSHVRERSENQRVETAGVYPLARRRGCGEPPRQRLAPILYAQEAAKPQFTSCTDRNRVLK